MHGGAVSASETAISNVNYPPFPMKSHNLTAQRNGLAALGFPAGRIYVDHGLTGRNRERPGLREALAAVRAGDTLVITKLDRLARSLPTPGTSWKTSPNAT
jgi:hypothetical protein